MVVKSAGGNMRAVSDARMTPGKRQRRERRRLERAAAKARKRGEL